MNSLLFILAFICLTQLKAQGIDKDYVVNWIKAIDATYQPDSVIQYRIDREIYYTYDTLKFNTRLQQIDSKQLKSISYSKYRMDNYVPGKGTIYILTIKKMKTSNVKSWLDRAKTSFVDSYISFSQHIFTNSKDPVLLVDNKPIHHTEAKETLNKLKPKEIYDISVGRLPASSSIYGQNAKNGLVQIWTKSFMRK